MSPKAYALPCLTRFQKRIGMGLMRQERYSQPQAHRCSAGWNARSALKLWSAYQVERGCATQFTTRLQPLPITTTPG